MLAEDQSEVIKFLHELRGATAVERIETHISYVFLVGDRAFKMKRAVKLPYVDFSTPGLRLAACEKEVALNAVTAPGLYLGVRKIMSGTKEGPFEMLEIRKSGGVGGVYTKE